MNTLECCARLTTPPCILHSSSCLISIRSARGRRGSRLPHLQRLRQIVRPPIAVHASCAPMGALSCNAYARWCAVHGLIAARRRNVVSMSRSCGDGRMKQCASSCSVSMVWTTMRLCGCIAVGSLSLTSYRSVELRTVARVVRAWRDGRAADNGAAVRVPASRERHPVGRGAPVRSPPYRRWVAARCCSAVRRAFIAPQRRRLRQCRAMGGSGT